MAMTTCKECGGPISTSAIACPTCGVKTKIATYSTGEKLVLLAIVILIVIATVGQIFYN